MADMPLDGYRDCSKCGVGKPPEAYSKDKKSPTGRLPYCRPCRKAARRSSDLAARPEVNRIRRAKYLAARGGNIRRIENRKTYDPSRQWQCSDCGASKAATTENFRLHRHKCRLCERDGMRQRIKDDPEHQQKLRAARRGRYLWEPTWLDRLAHKTCPKCKIELPANPAWFRLDDRRPAGLYSWCRCCEARHYDDNRAKRIAGQRKYLERRKKEAPEEIRQARLAWQRANRERKRSNERRWREQNLDKARAQGVASSGKRRAAQVEANGSFTPSDIDTMRQGQKGRCWYCSKVLKKFHVDHRIPLSRGGSNSPDNLVLACPPCNWSKGAKMPWELEVPRLL